MQAWKPNGPELPVSETPVFTLLTSCASLLFLSDNDPRSLPRSLQTCDFQSLFISSVVDEGLTLLHQSPFPLFPPPSPRVISAWGLMGTLYSTFTVQSNLRFISCINIGVSKSLYVFLFTFSTILFPKCSILSSLHGSRNWPVWGGDGLKKRQIHGHTDMENLGLSSLGSQVEKLSHLRSSASLL